MKKRTDKERETNRQRKKKTGTLTEGEEHIQKRRE
jgi:hypothetical protein